MEAGAELSLIGSFGTCNNKVYARCRAPINEDS